mgnify:CR=1 FL=1
MRLFTASGDALRPTCRHSHCGLDPYGADPAGVRATVSNAASNCRRVLSTGTVASVLGGRANPAARYARSAPSAAEDSCNVPTCRASHHPHRGHCGTRPNYALRQHLPQPHPCCSAQRRTNRTRGEPQSGRYVVAQMDGCLPAACAVNSPVAETPLNRPS